MSLILDALNRSRQDSDPVPGLGTRHDADLAQSPVAAWRRYLPWAALLVAVLVIGLLLLERQGPAPPKSVTVSPVPAPQTPAAGGVPPTAFAPDPEPAAKRVAPITAAPQPVSGTEPASALPTPLDPEVAQLYEQPVADLPEPVTSVPAVDDQRSEESSMAEAAVPQPPAREEQQVDIEKLVLQAREEVENARLAEHDAPFISDLSQQTKNAIPTVYYQRHDYAGGGAGSRVVLNGESMGEGGSPAQGMKVVEILPDSVVLNYRGTEFRLRALNSWINL